MDKDEALDLLLRRTSRADRRGAGTCLDADTLAAFSEGSVSDAERALAEAHAADCDRCLALIAAMIRTTPTGVPSRAGPASWFSWRWILPLAMATAAVLLAVAVQREADVSRQTEAQPSTARLGPMVSEPQAENSAKDTPPPAGPPPAGERGLPAGRRRAEATKTAASPPPRALKDQAPATPAAPASQMSGAGSDELLGSLRVGGAAATAERPVADMPTRRTEASEETRQSRAFDAAAVPLELSSPTPSVRWRIAGAVVARSADGGRTWQEQFTGSGVPLLAGSAPSDRVCWIVGRGGLVLLTTDGLTWRPAKSPTTLDLIGVKAADADNATVTAVDGRAFRTADGGQTWFAQENRPAPF